MGAMRVWVRVQVQAASKNVESHCFTKPQYQVWGVAKKKRAAVAKLESRDTHKTAMRCGRVVNSVSSIGGARTDSHECLTRT